MEHIRLKHNNVVPNLAKLNIPIGELLTRKYSENIIVSERSRLLYCPVPKVANTNWKYLIRKFEGFDDYADVHRAHLRQTSGLRYLSDYSPKEAARLLADPSYFKFVFVRDPYTRALSAYMDKFRKRDQFFVPHLYMPFLADLYDWGYVKSVDVASAPRPSFRQFVDELAKMDPTVMNSHWRPQTLHCGVGEMPYDFIGRMENLERDAKHVLKVLNKTSEHFPTHNEIEFQPSGASTPAAEELYTLDLMFKVRVIYQKDFSLLAY